MAKLEQILPQAYFSVNIFEFGAWHRGAGTFALNCRLLI
jgi:hypothetical protein